MTVVKLPAPARPDHSVVSLYGKGIRRLEDGSFYKCVDGKERYWIEFQSERMIHGVISTCTRSSHGHVLDPAGCRFTLPVPLLSRHAFKEGERSTVTNDLEKAKIGSIVTLVRSQRAVYIQASLDDTLAGKAAWDLILRGETRCLSVGSRSAKLQGVVEGTKYFSEWDMVEGSVVRRGANPDCWCEPYRPGFTEISQWDV
jgi:hypothetical protein